MNSSASSTARTGLPPVLGARPRVLILGSMPGEASLAAGAYYAHPRNAFWQVLGHWAGVDPAAPYTVRLEGLTRAGIGLWDVIGQCRRRGSLDSAIDPDSIVVNDVVGRVAAAPTIHCVITNGGLAARLYRRHLRAALTELRWLALPSTSPANARGGLQARIEAWRPLAEALSTGC